MPPPRVDAPVERLAAFFPAVFFAAVFLDPEALARRALAVRALALVRVAPDVAAFLVVAAFFGRRLGVVFFGVAAFFTDLAALRLAMTWSFQP